MADEVKCKRNRPENRWIGISRSRDHNNKPNVINLVDRDLSFPRPQLQPTVIHLVDRDLSFPKPQLQPTVMYLVDPDLLFSRPQMVGQNNIRLFRPVLDPTLV